MWPLGFVNLKWLDFFDIWVILCRGSTTVALKPRFPNDFLIRTLGIGVEDDSMTNRVSRKCDGAQ